METQYKGLTANQLQQIHSFANELYEETTHQIIIELNNLKSKYGELIEHSNSYSIDMFEVFYLDRDLVEEVLKEENKRLSTKNIETLEIWYDDWVRNSIDDVTNESDTDLEIKRWHNTEVFVSLPRPVLDYEYYFNETDDIEIINQLIAENHLSHPVASYSNKEDLIEQVTESVLSSIFENNDFDAWNDEPISDELFSEYFENAKSTANLVIEMREDADFINKTLRGSVEKELRDFQSAIELLESMNQKAKADQTYFIQECCADFD